MGFSMLESLTRGYSDRAHSDSGQPLTPDYIGKSGMRAELDAIAHAFFDGRQYDPRHHPRGYAERVDHAIYHIYQVLRGDAKREVRSGNKLKQQSYHTWSSRSEQTQAIIGAEEDKSSLLYNLRKALDKSEIDIIGSNLRLDMLDRMFEVALKNNKYLKTAYGAGLEHTDFYRNQLASLESVRTLVKNYDYTKGFSLASVLEWGPVAAMLGKGQLIYNNGKARVSAARSVVQNMLNTISEWGRGQVELVKSLKLRYATPMPEIDLASELGLVGSTQETAMLGQQGEPETVIYTPPEPKARNSLTGQLWFMNSTGKTPTPNLSQVESTASLNHDGNSEGTGRKKLQERLVLLGASHN